MLVRLTASRPIARDIVAGLVPRLIDQGFVTEVWTHAIGWHLRREDDGSLSAEPDQVAIDCLASDPADVRGIREEADRSDLAVSIAVIGDR